MTGDLIVSSLKCFNYIESKIINLMQLKLAVYKLLLDTTHIFHRNQSSYTIGNNFDTDIQNKTRGT